MQQTILKEVEGFYRVVALRPLRRTRGVRFDMVEHFTVNADHVMHEGNILHEGAAMLVWPRGVFHRIVSDPVEGSASLNLATHYDGFNIETNFSVYDLNTDTGAYRVIRKGSLDQP